MKSLNTLLFLAAGIILSSGMISCRASGHKNQPWHSSIENPADMNTEQTNITVKNESRG